MANGRRGPDRQVSDAEILRTIQNIPFPAVTSGDIEQRVDLTAKQINNRLTDMEKRALVRSKVVGASAKVWTTTHEGDELAAEY